MTRYCRPTSLQEALTLKAQSAGDAPLTVLAGGTDIYPVRTQRAAWFEPYPDDMLDISAIAELGGIDHGPQGTRIGASASWSAVMATELPPAFDALKQASAQIGGVQIQNRGTLAGNLCNASPAADGVPPLLALDAEVELASVRSKRRLPLSAFIFGNRQTALAPDELLVAIHLPPQPDAMRSTFLKLGARSYLVISIASVAANLALDDAGRIASLSIAVGACSPAPQRLTALELQLLGQAASPALAHAIMPADLAPLSPIADVRASAAYRANAALVLVRRALADLLSSPLEAAA
jgi:N-methylhydantoinase B